MSFTAKNDLIDETSAVDGNDREASNAKQVTTSVRGNAGERILKALAKVDEKKRRRAARLAQVSKIKSIYLHIAQKFIFSLLPKSSKNDQ